MRQEGLAAETSLRAKSQSRGLRHVPLSNECSRPYLKKKKKGKPIWAIGQCVPSILNTVWASLGKGVKGGKRPPFLDSPRLTPTDADTQQAQ